LRFGQGQRAAICFHGYGEQAGTFIFLEKAAGEALTFISIDLPFHGSTNWVGEPNFEEEDLLRIVNGILAQENLSPPALTLIGFSLGGRVALSLYQAMPARIDRLVLLAPDGLKMNFWYWLSTQTWIGKSAFAFTMKHPGWFFLLLRMLNKMRLVNSSIFKFVNYYIDDEKARTLLYKRWIVLRKLRPGIRKIKQSISMGGTPVRLIYGRHDRIILPVRGEKFRRGIEDHCIISVIHSGHQVLHGKHVDEIVPALFH
jgi:pimeloyl-ACP methyl ester carboxylesterase